MTYSPHKATHRTNTYLTARVRTLIQLGEIDLTDFVHWDYGRFAAESFAQEGYGYAVGYCMVLFLLMRQLGEEIGMTRAGSSGLSGTSRIISNKRGHMERGVSWCNLARGMLHYLGNINMWQCLHLQMSPFSCNFAPAKQ